MLRLLWRWMRMDHLRGFMPIEKGHMEALFADPVCHGTRIGTRLVRHGLSLHPTLTTDVNEQIEQAVRFYKRMESKRTGRSELDGKVRRTRSST
jgi:putative acetyltransferase